MEEDRTIIFSKDTNNQDVPVFVTKKQKQLASEGIFSFPAVLFTFLVLVHIYVRTNFHEIHALKL